MALKIKHYHVKSTSDILNDPVTDTEACSDYNSCISSLQDIADYKYSRRDKNRSAEEIAQTPERKTKTPKSQSFMKKLFTNVEKKNESCKADNEFITRYYRRGDSSEKDYSSSMEDMGLYDNYRTYTRTKYHTEFEKILKHQNEEKNRNCATLDCNRKVKLSRKKSFKNFLGSMMRWKKSENKHNPKRYLSYDDLMDGEMKRDLKNDDNLSRTVSLHTVILRNEGENENESLAQKRQDDLRNPASGTSNKNELQKWVIEETKRLFLKEQSTLSLDEGMDEVLVRPSMVKNIAKRYSQIPEEFQCKKIEKQLIRRNSVREGQNVLTNRFFEEMSYKKSHAMGSSTRM